LKFTKLVLLINGIIDVIIGISLVFFPNLIAQLLSYPLLTDHAFFFAGGWGIAAISFGVARIWAFFVDSFVWYNVTVGLFEGTILSIFSIVIPLIYSSVSFIHTSMSLAVGSVFMVLYGVLLLLHFSKKKNVNKELD